MMKYIFFLFLLFPSLSIAVMPKDEWKAEDEVDVDQKNKDKKIWVNLLAVYDNTRKIAEGSLTIMNRVADFAWAAEKNLQTIERIATRAQTIWNNIEKLQQFNVFSKENRHKSFFVMVKDITTGSIKAIEYTEEDIFQQSDALFYKDIPSYKNSRAEMATARSNILSSVDDEADLISNLNQKLRHNSDFENKQLILASAYSTDTSVYSKAQSEPEIRRALISQNTAFNALATSDLRQEELDNNSIPIQLTIKKASDPDAKLNTADLTQTSLMNERNRLAFNITENEITHDAIRTASQLLLAKVSQLDQRIAQKQLYLNIAVKVSDALIAQREKEKK